MDNSGRGADETALVILAELHGTLFWLDLWAGLGGFEPETLAAIAKRCVRFRVNKLRVEANFGDGMFAALLRPVLEAEWKKHNDALEKARRGGHKGDGAEPGGTEIEEFRSSNQMAKERRILSVLEPVTQQHRLVVARRVLEWDYESLSRMDAAETRHRYAWGYQFTHLTRSADSLHHDDRLDALAGAVVDFADILGVDPSGMAETAKTSRTEEELAALYGDLEEGDEEGGGVGGGYRFAAAGRLSRRPVGLKPAKR